MGFYNIYRILKDMLRTLFGKRFLKITIIVILIFTIFFVYNECFALSTIPPITVNGVTFDFSDSTMSNKWYSDHPSFRGNMDNITILRYDRIDNEYLYVFSRSSYPIYITHTKDKEHTNSTRTRIYSYDDNGKSTYFMYNRDRVSRKATKVSAGSPSFR